MTTTLHKLRCQGCGASVPVKQDLRYIDCEYCASRLEIVAPGQKANAALVSEYEALKLRGQLRDLDDAWKKYFEQVSVRDSAGALQAPDAANVVAHAMLGLVTTLISSALIAQVSLWCVALVFPVGLWVAWVFVSAARQRKQAFDSARSRYHFRRDELLGKLGANGEAAPR